MKLVVETKGVQDKTHCSGSGNINCCDFMHDSLISNNFKKCRLFPDAELEFDLEYYGYKRCRECIESEVK